MLRKDEQGEGAKKFFHIDLDLHILDRSARFLGAFKDLINQEEKRKIIGRLFIRNFKKEANRLGKADYLVQGTLYPDVIESVSFKGP